MAVEIVDTFPHAITEIEFERIPLSDGVHLSCRYWLPEDADQNPVPAILEYIPYCTRDGTAARDEAMHPYFAGHGYSAIRVDIRGSGDESLFGYRESEFGLRRPLQNFFPFGAGKSGISAKGRSHSYG